MSARQFKPELNELKICLLNYSDGKIYGNPFFSHIKWQQFFLKHTEEKHTQDMIHPCTKMHNKNIRKVSETLYV